MRELLDKISQHYRCQKCQGREANIKELAMTGTGLSKLFDIQHNHYLFVSCTGCGYTEIYDPEVLLGKQGVLMSILDLFFG